MRRLFIAFLVSLGVCLVASFIIAIVAYIDSSSWLLYPFGALVVVPIPVMMVILYFLVQRGLRDEPGSEVAPTAGPITAGIAAAVAHFFPTEDRVIALTTLADYGVEPDEAEPTRVQHAIIRLSGGDIDRLRYYTNQAKQEYRDVLAWDAETSATHHD
jgi:hypothetical protein